MATRTISASGGTRNWNDTASWEEAAVPTNADDVVARADGTSGNLTINVAAACKSIDLANYASGRTLTHATGVTVSVGGSTAGAGNIAIRFSAAMGYTANSSTTSLWAFVGTFGTTPQTITSNGKVVRLAAVSGAGGSLQLTDTFNYGSGITLALTAGTFDTNGQTVSGGSYSTSGSTARTLTLGATTWTLAQGGTTGVWVVNSTTNYTFNRGTSTLSFASTSATQGISASSTFNNITVSCPGTFQVSGTPNIAGNFTRSAPASPTVNDALVLASNMTVGGVFTVAAGVGFRLIVQSNTFGTARTVTVNGSVAFTRIDFQDITAAGTAGTWNLSTVGGDAGGNTNITFRASGFFYWIGGTGNFSDTTKWSFSSGGAPAGFFPTPQDDVVFDANSFSAAGQTVTVDIPRLGRSVNFTGVTNNPTWAATVATTMFGSLTLVAGMTRGTFSGALTMAGRSAATITSAGKQLPPLTISQLGSSVTLSDDLDLGANTLTHTWGTFDANAHNVSAGAVVSSSGNTRTLTMGSGTWTLSGVGSVWTINTNGLTLNVNTSRLVISDATATTKQINISQATGLYDLVIPASGAGQINILFTLSVNSINIGAGRTVQLQSGRTLTVASAAGWQVSGAAGNLVTIVSSTSGTAASVSVASGIVSSDYLSLQDSTATGGATFYAGSHSTNVSGNTGWLFNSYVSVTMSESLSVSDSLARSVELPRSATESLSVSDSPSGLRSLLRSVSESVSVADSVSRLIAAARSVSESLNTADVPSSHVSQSRVLAESLSIADVTTRSSFAQPRTASEALNIADSPSSSVAFARSITDTLTITMSDFEAFSFVRSISEALSVTDSESRSRVLAPRSLSETITVSDSLARAVSFASSASESLNIADANAESFLVQRTAAESLSIADSLINPRIILAFLTESLTVSDHLTATGTNMATKPGRIKPNSPAGHFTHASPGRQLGTPAGRINA